QAEDGIRDGHVTGVQTCALPISAYRPEDADRLLRRVERDTAGIPLLAVAMLEAVAQGFQLQPEAPAWPAPQRTLIDSLPSDLPRSEERRVGKEGGCRGSRCAAKT